MGFKSCWSHLKLARFTKKTTDLRENRTFLPLVNLVTNFVCIGFILAASFAVYWFMLMTLDCICGN